MHRSDPVVDLVPGDVRTVDLISISSMASQKDLEEAWYRSGLSIVDELCKKSVALAIVAYEQYIGSCVIGNRIWVMVDNARWWMQYDMIKMMKGNMDALCTTSKWQADDKADKESKKSSENKNKSKNE